MRKLARRLWEEVKGQDLTEYALLVALISLGATAAMQGVASPISAVFSNAFSSMS